jgi:hypothetical protein
MIIWIAVYSLFTTSTFTSEFVELLGTVDFWASVLLSVVLAIGTYLFLSLAACLDHPHDRSSTNFQVCFFDILSNGPGYCAGNVGPWGS